jgi:hypothetical protein
MEDVKSGRSLMNKGSRSLPSAVSEANCASQTSLGSTHVDRASSGGRS